MRLREDPPEQLGQIVHALAGVENAVARIDDARADLRTAGDADAAATTLEEAVGAWLAASEEAAAEWMPQEGAEPETVEGRSPRVGLVGGLAMLNLAAAADIARLSFVDDLPEVLPEDPWAHGRPGPDVEPAPRLSAIQQVAGDTGDDQAAVIAAMTTVLADQVLGVPNGNNPGIDLLREIVDSAAAATTTVLKKAVPNPAALFGDAHAIITSVLDAAPQQLQAAFHAVAGKIKWLAARVVEHAQWLLSQIPCFDDVLDLVRTLFDAFELGDRLLEAAVRLPVAGILTEPQIQGAIIHSLRAPLGHAPDKLTWLRRQHELWVGKPIPVLAKLIPWLRPLHLGAVPAVPIGALLLVVWTLMASRDQLDSQVEITDFWRPGLRSLY